MFNVGGGEILVILLVALIVLGPQRLPGAVRQAGQFMGELRKMSSGFQQELRTALDEVDSSSATNPTAIKPISDGGPAEVIAATEADAARDEDGG